ncbi:hypothetical protein EDD53_0165 [Pacificibacter maritimus]|uniref:Uncharacterized protein n=1 Tax=Pacificibacter maritimus TaxID=762213 RepID=A0A3N4UKD4_9RHOB|nr:hypothetical protein [Pacificibacter maritimus]RPE71052.1 hypothetical protein EDD53_0165 [Pacificibacter maritimus]
MKRFLHILLFLGVACGLIVPKSTVLLAELGVISGQVIVICTGEGLQKITLDADGNPVEVDMETDPCALSHVIAGADLSNFGAPYPSFVELANYPRPHEVAGPGAAFTNPFSRAPPVV